MKNIEHVFLLDIHEPGTSNAGLQKDNGQSLSEAGDSLTEENSNGVTQTVNHRRTSSQSLHNSLNEERNDGTRY